MAFTKIAAAGIGSTGIVTLENVVITGNLNAASATGAASTANVRTNSLVVSGVTTFSGNVSIAGTLTYEDVTNIDSIGVVTARSGVVINSGGLVVNAGVSTLGITTIASLTTQQVNVSGISTFGNTVVGGATTQLIVNGNARITGILTIGTSSITFDGNTDSVRIGTAVTITSGIVSATEFRGNGINLTSINASNLGSGTIPDARFPATLPAVSGANLTGIAAFPAGTLMLFQQTAAPTGWTKQTTHDNKALRVVSGSASSGGSTAFTSVFASRTPSGSVSVSGSNSGGGVSDTTLTTTTMPSHSHTIARSTNLNNSNDTCLSTQGVSGSVTTSAVGSSGAHGHGFTNPSWSGSASFSGSSMDFAVQYVDLIIASKN
jgi:hypothetical protein